MKRRTRIVLFVLVPALVVIGGFIAAPTWIADAVEERVQKALKNRGVESSWTSFSAGLGRSFEIENLVLRIPRFGVSLRSDRVRVGVHIEDLTNQEVTLTEVFFDHLDLDWNIESIRSLRKNEPPKPLSPHGSEKMGRLMRSVIKNPPEIIARALRVNVERDRLAIATITSEKIRAVPENSVYKISGKGLARLASESPLPHWLVKDIPWKAQGSLAPHDRSLQISLTSWNEEPLIDLGDSDTLRIRLESLVANLQGSTQEIALHGSGLMTRFGDHRKPAMHVIVPTWTITKEPGNTLFLSAEHPLMHIAPQVEGKWSELKTLARHILRGIQPTTIDSEPEPLGPKTNVLWQSLIRKATALNAHIRNLKLEVDVVDEAGKSDTLTLVHNAFARLDKGRIEGWGSVAQGEVVVQADILPGIARPSFISTELKGVVLDEIPGMPKGRSELPSRGTSGRLGGKVDGHITMIFPTLLYESTPDIGATGLIDLNWRDGLIDLAGVSEEALTSINATATGAWTWKPAVDTLRFERLKLAWGPVQVNARASIDSVSFDPELTLRAHMKEIACEQLFRAIPNGLLGPMKHLKMDGDVAPKLYFRLPVHRPRKLRLYLSQYEDSCTLLSLARRPIAPSGLHFQPASPGSQGAGERDMSDVHWLSEPFVKTLTDYIPEDAVVKVGPGLDSYIPLNELPPYVGGIAYLSEQILFYEDPAVSLALMTKALGLNLERRRFVYGGSTVTQQLIKNLFLSRDKTLARKVREALISWRVLDIIPRKRILELYLNCIEYAPGVYGIGPAAQFYFQKDARRLTPNEAMFLAMLKPAPHRGVQYMNRGKTPVRQNWWKKRLEQLYDRLVTKGYITQSMVEAERPYILRWDKNGKYLPEKPKRTIHIPLLE